MKTVIKTCILSPDDVRNALAWEAADQLELSEADAFDVEQAIVRLRGDGSVEVTMKVMVGHGR